MAKHVNKSSNIRRIVVKRNFDALYKSRNSGDTYSEQDMQHLKLIEPNAVLPRGYTSIPRIPRSPRINRSINNAALDNFEKEYEAFIAEQRRLKAEREAKEAAAKAASEQTETTASEVDDTKVPVFVGWEIKGETVPVEEVKNEVTSEETVTSENTEEVPVVETKSKKRTKKKTVAEPVDTVTETPETAETAE